MKKGPLFLLSLSLLPVFAHAQTLQLFLGNIIPVINSTIIPFLFGIAFLIFAINVIRFFVIGGSSEDSQEKAKALAMYGVLAFVLIIVFWGVVNLLASSLGLEGEAPVTSDYIDRSSGQNNSGNNSSPFCQQGALFDENGKRCPSTPLPSNPPPPINPTPPIIPGG